MSNPPETRDRTLQAAELSFLGREIATNAVQRELRMDRELAKARRASEERALGRQPNEDVRPRLV